MWRKALLAGAATTLLAGGTAFELDRRRLLRARDADPEWRELITPLGGRAGEATSADGTRLHVEVFGSDDAPTIVLIPGWLESIELWHHQIRALSSDFRIVAYDQRGHGRSAAPANGAYTDAALADDLHAVLDAFLPPGELCLAAGHSLGGMAIVAWAGRHPEAVHLRLGGVALVNTGMSHMMRRAAVLGPRAGERAHELGMRALFGTHVAWPPWFDRIALEATRYMAFAPDAGVGRVAFAHRMFTTTQPQVRAGFGRMFIPLDLSPAVRHLVAPAVVIGGRLDRLLPPWHCEQLAATLPELVEYVDLVDCGHMSPLEAPDRMTLHVGRLARACLLVRAAALEVNAFSSDSDVVTAGSSGTPDRDPYDAAPEEVTAIAQSAPEEAAAGAGELSKSSRREKRRRRRSAGAGRDRESR